jgi:membrane-bound lytic murein transglycosylase D
MEVVMNIIDPSGLRARDHRWSLKRWLPGAGSLMAPRSLWLLPIAVLPALFAEREERPVADAVTGDVAVADGGVLSASIPLHVNERVEKWVDRFTGSQRSYFQHLLERKGLYGDMIRQKLAEREMPEELLYLAMMESGLFARAVSSASAVGLWQFMGPTAQEFGLRVDEWVDERRDPVRATDAALSYIQWLHDRYDSWYLTAAAYNAGPGRVDRELRRHAEGRIGDEDLYWQILEHLPRETREYVPRLVAATLVAQQSAAHGFDDDRLEPYRFDRVFVPGGTSLSRIARSLDVDVRVLRNLNPHLVRGSTPLHELYPVRVPVGTSPTVVASLGRVGRVRSADD